MISEAHQRDLQKYYDIYTALAAEALSEARLLPHRTAALQYMPKNAVCCEVGVAYGDFSSLILAEMVPGKFFAIDYFSQNDPMVSLMMGRNDFKRDNMPHRQWYENRFRNEIASGVVEIKQGLSWECLIEFPDDYFDYAYIDAGHDFDSVVKDIDAIDKKMKNGGYIQFNDYGIYNVQINRFYGVVPAVNRFINTGGHKVAYFCLNRSSLHDIVIKICRPPVQENQV